jgi:hypothetical protein
VTVTVNDRVVYQSDNPAGRGYAPDADTVRLDLAKGRNRILVLSRQGIGSWCFSVQLARLAPSALASRPATGTTVKAPRVDR